MATFVNYNIFLLANKHTLEESWWKKMWAGKTDKNDVGSAKQNGFETHTESMCFKTNIPFIIFTYRMQEFV